MKKCIKRILGCYIKMFIWFFIPIFFLSSCGSDSSDGGSSSSSSGSTNGGSTTVSPPSQTANSVAFTDINPADKVVSGALAITKAANESNLTGYTVYWGSDDTTKLMNEPSITSIPKTGSDITADITDVSIPAGASHILVFSKNSAGESSTCADASVVDLTPILQSQSKTISSSSGGTISLDSGAAISFPSGTVTSDLEITMTETQDISGDIPGMLLDSYNGKFYTLEPDDLLMDSEATITIPYGELDSDTSPDDLLLQYFDGESWVDLPYQSVDEIAGTISAETNHFTHIRMTKAEFGNWVKGDKIDYSICNNQIQIDFYAEGPWKKLVHVFEYPFLELYDNVWTMKAYKLHLMKNVDWYADQQIRTIHVYGIIWYDKYKVANNGMPTFLTDPATMQPNYFLDQNDIFNLELEGYGSPGNEQFHVAHYVIVFDENGSVIDNGFSTDISDVDKWSGIATNDEAATNFLHHPTKSLKVQQAIPTSLIEPQEKYYFKVEIRKFNNGSDPTAKSKTKKQTIDTSTNDCIAISSKLPTLLITSPKPAARFQENQTIEFRCDGSDSEGNSINNGNAVSWTANNSSIGYGCNIDTTLSPGIYKVKAKFEKDTEYVKKEISIIVNPLIRQNRPPVFKFEDNHPILNSVVGQSYYTDFDYEEDIDKVTFSLIHSPNGMTIDPKSGVIYWEPLTSGVYNVEVGLSDTQTMVTYSYDLNIILEPNISPVIEKIEVFQNPVELDKGTAARCLAYDPEGSTINITWNYSNDINANVDNDSDTILWISPTATGTFWVTCNANDGISGVRETAHFSVVNSKPVDFDGDGFLPTLIPKDCDDDKYWINPGAEEVPGNTIDENCDGIIENLPSNYWYRDADNDGYGDANSGPLYQIDQPEGYKDSASLTEIRGDCNDNDSSIYPGATELPNSKDDNCNGIVDEAIGFVIGTVNENTNEDGAQTTFTVRLSSQPLADVTIGVLSDNEHEGTASPSSLTFTSENWNADQTVTVTGHNDDRADGNQRYFIVLSEAVSLDTDYNGFDPQDVEIVNVDNDSAGIIVSSISGNTGEDGTQATFTVRLTSEPSDDVEISLYSDSPNEGSVSPSTLTFTDQNWNGFQTVTVSGVDEYVRDGNQNYTIVLDPVISNDVNYGGLDPDDVPVINTDNETEGFIISSINGTPGEDGTQSTFSVKLTSQPTANVTITISSSDSGEGTVSPSSLTFTDQNWNANQTVTITGVDDNIIDGNQGYTIILGSATSTDTFYNGLDPDDVTMSTIDNDSAGFIVGTVSGNTREDGSSASFTVKLTSQPANDVVIPVSSTNTGEGTVSPSSLTFTDQNWNANQTVTIFGVNDDIMDGNQQFRITLGQATSSDYDYNGLDPVDVQVTNLDDDSAGFIVGSISGNTTEAGGTATFTIKLTSQPTAEVTLGISSNDPGEGAVNPSLITFTSENWNQEQTITVEGVDDYIADGSQEYLIILDQATSSDSNYDGHNPMDLLATNTDDDSAGFTVSAISGHTTEAGGTAFFTIRLNSEPTSDVEVEISSSDTGEGTVTMSSLSFDRTNWEEEQTVIVTGEDDYIEDGDQDYSIVLSASISSDGNYNGIELADVAVVNDDNDVAGIIVSSVSGNTSEGGGSVTFTVRLASEPESQVTIDLASDDESEGITDLTSLFFTNQNWDITSDHIVTITGVDDYTDDGDQLYHVILESAISADSNYNSLNPSDITLTNIDDDTRPVADASGDQIVETGSTITLDGSGSYDADGDPLTYQWSFVSKPSGSTAQLSDNTIVDPTFTVDLKGIYEIELIVNDGQEDSSPDIVRFRPIQKLPDTGQTTSYTTNYGEDSDYLINPPSFTDNGDGTVTDDNTGLVWQQEDDNTTRNWSDAGSYCSKLSLGGHSDWRLPNLKELQSIASLQGYDPALDTTVFLNANSSNYWSSTTYARDTSDAWYVYFYNGGVGYGDKTNSYYVRCVRGGSESVIWSLDFSVIGDGTVVHPSTGLTWQQEDGATTRSWESALSYCEGLSLGGYDDWRLPNVRELQTIVDYSQYNPAIDTQVFSNTNSSYYWSSTTYAGYTSYAWYVFFYNGRVYGDDKSNGHYVRCVRGGSE